MELSRELLHSLGYKVTTCSSSSDALQKLKRVGNTFDCIITDQTMPQLSGIELARKAIVLRPQLPVILCTGYSTTVDEHIAHDAGIMVFLMKPLTIRELSDALSMALDGAQDRPNKDIDNTYL